jgi:hypothetical protein
MILLLENDYPKIDGSGKRGGGHCTTPNPIQPIEWAKK